MISFLCGCYLGGAIVEGVTSAFTLTKEDSLWDVPKAMLIWPYTCYRAVRTMIKQR